MKILNSFAILLLLLPAGLRAQESFRPSRVQGYLFLGDGLLTVYSAHYGILHTGGGTEVRLFKGLHATAEMGVMGRSQNGEGLWSIGSSYHFADIKPKQRFDPFVLGGYSRSFSGPPPAGTSLDVGAGFNYWCFRRIGFRMEFRDYVHPDFRSVSNFPELRLGVVIRTRQRK